MKRLWTANQTELPQKTKTELIERDIEDNIDTTVEEALENLFDNDENLNQKSKAPSGHYWNPNI